MMPSKKVKFTQDFTPKGQHQPSYAKGAEYDLEISYAEKYARLGLCSIIGDAAPLTVMSPPGPKFDASVQIPNDWRQLNPAPKMDLAKKLGAPGITSGALATAAIIDALKLDRPVLSGWSYGPLVILDYLRHYGEDRIGGIHFVGGITKLGSDAAMWLATAK